MNFNSLEYACLLIGALAVSWILSERRSPRVFLLLLASYGFYASWNAKYVLLIFASSSLDFLVGQQLGKEQRSGRRKGLLALSVTVNLGILCTFKYFNFFIREASAAFEYVGVDPGGLYLDLLLPVGISFYTFQTLSYTIDVYRGKLAPVSHYFEYLLFVSFFPQLVAGPIVRASALLPQIAALPKLTAQKGSRALYRIGLGLVKKVAIADFLGAQLVDPVFSNPQMYSSLETLIATYAYAFQIYADFSAYSDIAIGSATLLGFHIPENFNAPYRARNLRDFWQRWHISLSTWLRDYLYIPLGGSQSASWRTYLNLMITMLLGGLWHGASMTFVVWGSLHGGALVITRLIQRSKIAAAIPPWVQHILGVFFTFHLVTAAWVFFRSPSFGQAFAVFEAIAAMDPGLANISAPVLVVLGIGVATHWIPKRWMERSQDVFHALPAPVQAIALIGMILGVQQVARTEVAPFIYFQF